MNKINLYRYALTAILLLVSWGGLWAQGKTIETAADIDAFIETSVSKYTMHVSDTLTLSYRLYSSEKVTQVAEMKLPAVRGFRATNINPSQEIKEVVIDKKKYYMYEVRRTILQPQSAGKKSLPEGTIIFEYTVPTNQVKRSPFGDVKVMRRIHKSIPVESVSVNVHDMQAI